jgi:acetyltransferase-like isoleucine patch superfamily enzyme
MKIRRLILYFIKVIRNENFELGNFSNVDLFRIILIWFYRFLRGFIFNLYHLNKFKILFLGRNTSIIGNEKLNFIGNATIGSNVKISTIGGNIFTLGKNISIRDYTIIDSFGSLKKESGSLFIGNNVGISEFCYFAIRGNLSIGNDVIIGPGVKIFTENHSFDIKNMSFRLQEEIRKDVIIGNNVWIGANSTILSGVNIGSNVVIAAGSVVNKNIESNCIYAGVPAKFIKNLY